MCATRLLQDASTEAVVDSGLRGYYDRPNLSGDPQFNVINGDSSTNDADNYQIRGDHQFGDYDRAWFRYSKIDGAQLGECGTEIDEQGGGHYPFCRRTARSSSSTAITSSVRVALAKARSKPISR